MPEPSRKPLPAAAANQPLPAPFQAQSLLVPALLVLAALLLSSCRSQLPLATTYSATGQHKMQAAHHWDVLADDVAQQVADALHDRVDLRLLPIDVVAEDKGPFSDVFAELLMSRLVQRGVQVASAREGIMALRFKVQMVLHGKRSQRPVPGALTAIGAGVSVARDVSIDWLYGAAGLGLLADVGVGYLTSHSDHEVVVTTAMVHKNRYVMRSSDIYYINDQDNLLYAEPLPPVGAGGWTGMEPLPATTMGVAND